MSTTGTKASPSDESLKLPIDSLTTTLVDVPLLRPHRFSVTSMTRQSMVIVRLRTSDGIEGIGEAVVPGGPWWGGESIEGIKALIDTYIAPLVIGRDASRVGAISSFARPVDRRRAVRQGRRRDGHLGRSRQGPVRPVVRAARRAVPRSNTRYLGGRSRAGRRRHRRDRGEARGRVTSQLQAQDGRRG